MVMSLISIKYFIILSYWVRYNFMSFPWLSFSWLPISAIIYLIKSNYYLTIFLLVNDVLQEILLFGNQCYRLIDIKLIKMLSIITYIGYIIYLYKRSISNIFSSNLFTPVFRYIIHVLVMPLLTTHTCH